MVNRMNEPDYLPLDANTERALYRAIRALPATRKWKCSTCGKENECSSLLIHSQCAGCGCECKLRASSGAADLQDFLLIALQWFHNAGVQVPEELRPLVEGNWEEWDEYFEEEDD